MLRNFLVEPKLASLENGSPEFFRMQSEVIKHRPLLAESYSLWYRTLLKDATPGIKAPVMIELGSGGGFFKDFAPQVMTSDVTPGIADMVVDARSLPFADDSVDAIFCTHCFHHIPDVAKFLGETQRVLKPGGVLSLVDAAHTPFSRFFFKNFHPEPYRDDAADWSFEQGNSMEDSNQALTWIVFFRDRERFLRAYPNLKLERFQFLPFLAYFLSGGVTRKNLIPAFMLGTVRAMDRISYKLFAPWLAIHWSLTIRKTKDRSLSET